MKNKLCGDQDGTTPGCSCSCPLTGDLTSSACICGCVVNGISAKKEQTKLVSVCHSTCNIPPTQ